MSDIEQIGRDVAEQVVGEDAVEQIEVRHGLDSSERPVYQFFFLIEPSRARQRLGLLHIRLTQKLLDELEARGDGHLATVHLLNRADWNMRSNA